MVGGLHKAEGIWPHGIAAPNLPSEIWFYPMAIGSWVYTTNMIFGKDPYYRINTRTSDGQYSTENDIFVKSEVILE